MEFFPLLENANEEVSANHKKEVATIMEVVPKVSFAVTSYSSHHLGANVQFSAIDIIIQSTKTD